MHFLSRIFCLILLSLASCRAQDSAASYQAAGHTVYSNLTYSEPGGDQLALDVYLPTIAPAHPSPGSVYPVIVWIHGGGWRWGDKDSIPVIKLTDFGFAIVSIDYRLDGNAKYPAQIEDCRAALAWLQEHGSAYFLDINRLGLLGPSAGGHLVALLGTTAGDFPKLPKIRAVCALYPPTDLVTIVTPAESKSTFGPVPLLLGGSVDEKHDLAVAASPVHFVSSKSPPFFLIHGQEDELVPVEQSIELRDALVKAGVPCKLKIIPGKKHGFYPDAELTGEIVSFFTTYLAP